MDIYNYAKEELLKRNITSEIELIMPIGSSLVFEEYNDIDYLVVLNELPESYEGILYIIDPNLKIDLIIKSRESYQRDMLNLDGGSLIETLVFSSNVLGRRKIIYGEFNYDFDFFKLERKFKEKIKDILARTFFSEESLAFSKGKLPRKTFWLFVALSFYKERKIIISPLAKHFARRAKKYELEYEYVKEWIEKELNTIYGEGGE